MEEGKLLWHIVSKYGVKIDPECVTTIKNIPYPWNKKGVQYFIGKINFLRRFITNFFETMKQITDMLKNDQEIKWTLEARSSFDKIKQAIWQSLVLIIPDYSKYFLIFSFASENTIVAVLLQKNNEEREHPIALFSRSLRDPELKYAMVEKQAYALVKALKSFRDYNLHSEVIAYVPSSAIK